eukprot:TRINITY_DN6935_c0_g1_i1.p1 TRINITY_DN6935_c0_g1~~TRINITY_DN6935_c0_g1_i1.p1  ORF type:complete len:987 (+),score=140.82 TRINITY_DN6935_c0_g1_i1:91-3051(+)
MTVVGTPRPTPLLLLLLLLIIIIITCSSLLSVCAKKEEEKKAHGHTHTEYHAPLLSLIEEERDAGMVSRLATFQAVNEGEDRGHTSMDNGHAPSSSSYSQWTTSGNVATYLNVTKVRAIHVPVNVNIIVVGFDGDGRNAIKIGADDLESWLAHADHSLRHLVVPVGEQQATTGVHDTERSRVEYRMSYSVVKLSPLVNTILEDHLVNNARPENPELCEDDTTEKPSEVERFYVDAFRFNTILSSLTSFLGVNNSYSLFILNPKSPMDNAKQIYGYRAGFSDQEIQLLYNTDDFRFDLPLGPPASASSHGSRGGKTGDGSMYTTADLLTGNIGPRVKTIDFTLLSESWAMNFISTNIGDPNLEQRAWATGDGREEDDARMVDKKRVAKIHIMDLAGAIAENGTLYEKLYLRKVQQEGVHANCMSDTWVGHGRFAFVDLTAGPFQWGPIVGGEGVRTLESLPEVPVLSDKHTPEKVLKLAHESFVDYGQRLQGYAENEVDSIAKSYEENCFGPATSELFCINLSKRHGKLLNLIREKHLDITDLKGTLVEGEGADHILDGFLSELSSVVSSSLKHLVVPPSPLFEADFSDRVSFDVTLIRSHESYDPRAVNYFDFDSFKSEMGQFRLPHQEFTFSFKEVTTSSEPALTMAYQTSLRSVMIPSLGVNGDFKSYSQLYINSMEFRRQLDAIRTRDKKGKRRAKLGRRIPIFIISMDYPNPVLVDKYYQAKALSDMVIAVQSDIPEWESRLACSNKPIYWDLRNPLRALLQASALSLGGLVPTHIEYNEAARRAGQNWLWSVGDNPVSSTTSSGAHFNQFQFDTVHRHFLVSDLDRSVALVNDGVEALKGLKTSVATEHLVPSLSLSSLKNRYRTLRVLWLRAVGNAEHLDFDSSVLLQLRKLSLDFNEQCGDLVDSFTRDLCSMEGGGRVAIIRTPPSEFSEGGGGPSVTSDTPVKDNHVWVWVLSLLFNALLMSVVFLFKRNRPKMKTN